MLLFYSTRASVAEEAILSGKAHTHEKLEAGEEGAPGTFPEEAGSAFLMEGGAFGHFTGSQDPRPDQSGPCQPVGLVARWLGTQALAKAGWAAFCITAYDLP